MKNALFCPSDRPNQLPATIARERNNPYLCMIIAFINDEKTMIEYIKGELTQLTPTEAVLETAGVGYLLKISVNTYGALEGKKEAKLLVHEVIREAAQTLYGFAGERERTLFRQLIGVSGVGAGTAVVILSGFTVQELEAVISGGDTRALKNVKGIGAKTAERIIVDLRDKIKPIDSALLVSTPASAQVFEEASAALVMLGYTAAQTRKVLKKLFDESPTLKVEEAIRKALAMM